jgi:glutathione S-transferase
MYLLEKYDKKHNLLPKSEDLHKRGKMFQFIFFASAELYPYIAKSWEIMYRPGQTPEQMGKELAELGKVRKTDLDLAALVTLGLTN